MAGDLIKIEELVDVPGVVKGLTEINSVLNNMVKSLDVELRDAIKVLNEVKINDAKSLKEYNAAMVQAEKVTQERVKTSQLQLKAEQQLSKAIEQETKEKEKLVKAAKDINNAYKQESTRLNDLRNAYKNLATQGRENGKVARGLLTEIQALDTKLKAIDATVGQHQRNVGDYKNQMRELMKELRNPNISTERYNEVIEKVAEIRDKLDDAKDAIKELASGSKTEQLANSFEGLKEKIVNLDFEGAKEKSEQFASVLAKMSFKEVTDGIKNFGAAIGNVFKSLLLNPFVAIVAGIAALGFAVYEVVSAYIEFNRQSHTVNETMKRSGDFIAQLSDRYKKAVINIREATGQISKLNAELMRKDVENKSEQRDLQKQFSEDIKKLAEELDISLINQKKNFNWKQTVVFWAGAATRTADEKKFQRELKKLESEYQKDLLALKKGQTEEELEIVEKAAAEEREKAKEKYKDLLKSLEDYERQIQDMKAEDIRDEEARELRQLELQTQRKAEQAKKDIGGTEAYQRFIEELENNHELKKDEIREKYRKQREEQSDAERNKIAELDKKRTDALNRVAEDDMKLEIEILQAQFERKKQLGKVATADEIKEQEELLSKIFELRKRALEAEAAIKLQNAELTAEEIQEINKKLDNDIKRLELEKQKILGDSHKAQQEQEKEAQQKRLKDLYDYTNKAIDIAQKEIQKTTQLKQQALDKEISMREKSIGNLQNMAAQGNKEAAEQLEFEKKKLAEDLLQKEALRKREIKTQKELAMLKLIAGYAEKDPSTALQKAAIDIALEGIIAAAFWEGAENVGESLGKPQLKGRDGYIVRVDGSERVMTGEQNRMIGGMSNDELAQLAYLHRTGQYLPDYAMGLEVPRSTANNMAASIMLQSSLINEVKQLRAALAENKVQINTHWHSLHHAIEERLQGNKKEIINYLGRKPRL